MASVHLLPAIEKAFSAYSQGLAVVPPVGELLFEDPPGDAHIKFGYLRGDDTFLVKIATGFYENAQKGLAPSSGLMVVFDQRTGFVRAILLDEGLLTNLRTAAAGAVAAKYLAPKSIDVIGILGSGVQARLQAEHLKPVTPCRKIVLWARRAEAADACAADLRRMEFDVAIAAHPADVARSASLIVTTTATTKPLLDASVLRPGLHITAMGSDTSEKHELDVNVLAGADIVVADSVAQCRERGEISHALRAGVLADSRVIELGAIISGQAVGRTSDDQITVCDLTGVAVQDIAIAGAILAASG
jgi:ornithine cyclodeaminase